MYVAQRLPKADMPGTLLKVIHEHSASVILKTFSFGQSFFTNAYTMNSGSQLPRSRDIITLYPQYFEHVTEDFSS